MATKSFDELIAGANTIKDNQLPESNTSSLIGDQLVQMSTKLKEENASRMLMTNEYNVSVLRPTGGVKADGTAGGPYYTLETATAILPEIIAQLGGQFHQGNILSFQNTDTSHDVEKYEFNGGNDIIVSNFYKCLGALKDDISSLNKVANAITFTFKVLRSGQLNQVNLAAGNSYILKVNKFGSRYGDFGYKADDNSSYVKITTIDFTAVQSYIFKPSIDIKYILFTSSGDTSISVIPKENLKDLCNDLSNTLEDVVQNKVNNSYTNILNSSDYLDGSGYNNILNVFAVSDSWKGLYGALKLPWRNHNQITLNGAMSSGGFYYGQKDINNSTIAGSVNTGSGTITIDRVANAEYLCITIRPNTEKLRANYGDTLLPYDGTPNPIKGYIKDIECNISDLQCNISDLQSIHHAEDISKLYAYADGSTPDDATHFYGWKNGRCAWQRAIDSCDGNKRTKIYCKGTINVSDISQFSLEENGYYNIIFVRHDKNNIELIGEGSDKTALNVAMADSLANYDKYQPMEIWGDNIIVRGMKITSKNARYCIHMDASGGRQADNHTISFIDLELHHYDNAGKSFESCLGLGISEGMNLLVKGCTIINDRPYTAPFYLHDNVGFKEDFNWQIIDCKCINNSITSKTSATQLMTIQTLGSGIHGNIIIDNIDTGMNKPLIYAEINNTASKTNIDNYDSNIYINIRGNMNMPISYEVGNSSSRVLKITSKSTGTNSSVRFGGSSSAFNLVKGKTTTGFTDISGRVHSDNYMYMDGVEGYSGYAIGEAALDINKIVSIQHRLGDCSTSNKNLVVSIDGTDYNIVFNQNYTNYSDAQMLAVFTDVLKNVADVELYNLSAEYFPEINSTYRKNTSSSIIKCGYGVKITSDGIFAATSDSELNGIAIEDILPSKYGRVVTTATLSIFEADAHHIALEEYPATDSEKYTNKYQGYFGIGTTQGVFVKKDNGPVTMRYWGSLTFSQSWAND